MHLDSLADDVILEICSYLCGRDALNLSRVSRRLYPFAIARVAPFVHFQDTDRLRRSCDYLLPRHAQYLRALVIGGDFGDDHDDDYWPDGLDLVANLLRAAPNLRDLALAGYHDYRTLRPCISDSLLSMRALLRVRFSSIYDATLAKIRLPVTVEHLALSFRATPTAALERREEALPSLLHVVESLPGLHTLELEHFTPQAPWTPELPAVYPLLPRLRSLRLYHSNIASLSIVHLCPNLSRLFLLLDEQPHSAEYLVGPQWNHLRSLIVGNIIDFVPIHGLVSGVDELEILEELYMRDTPRMTTESRCDDDDRVDRPWAYQPWLTEVLRIAHPARLSASVFVGQGGLAPLWHHNLNSSLRVRQLDLRINLQKFAQDSDNLQDGWIEQFAEAFRGVPLFGIRIFIPKLRFLLPGDEDREAIRSRSVLALPQRLLGAVPTLRRIAIADVSSQVPSCHVERDADHMRWWQWDGAPMGSQGNRWAVYDDETRRPSFESFKTWMKWNISHAERSGDVLLSLEPEADGCGGDGRDWYCIE
ncbi:hypothetical protein K466DRAFT_668192 [Polyporus arcularius HHB13444]|uniref:F-box domain-containing protein n=1 Tax=Polyporus arcularius HHB13444 TaxID=1314778 RepID=A0A5C3NQ89_9APHY|nr:hypothetical protein K466DRAFT_668192 [Polyporus arcularius HHB13444]